MMLAAIHRAAPLTIPSELVTAAARCWRAARDAGAPVQQRLYAMLLPHDCGMLAPVFASLMTLYQAALGRPVAVGRATLSSDERLLLGLLDGTRSRRACIACAEGSASALDCALCSTRIMMALTIPSDHPGHDADPAHIRLTIPN